jgi:hypothetical protein
MEKKKIWLRRGVEVDEELASDRLAPLRHSQGVPRAILDAHLTPSFSSRSQSSAVT